MLAIIIFYIDHTGMHLHEIMAIQVIQQFFMAYHIILSKFPRILNVKPPKSNDASLYVNETKMACATSAAVFIRRFRHFDYLSIKIN